MNSDLLDEYCEMEMGHTDWSMDWDQAGNLIVTFRKNPSAEYLADQEDDQADFRPVRMRKDLAKDGIRIPAGLSYKDYDDLQEIMYLSAEDLEGAVEFDTGEDPDSHAFCPAKLADGRVVYLIGVDLEWFDGEDL
jgi:hypothetical protein